MTIAEGIKNLISWTSKLQDTKIPFWMLRKNYHKRRDEYEF